MPSKRFALEKGGRPRLLLRWSRDWSELRVLLDGFEVGSIDGGRRALDESPSVELPEGPPITVERIPGAVHDTVRVSRSGTPLPVNDPHARLRLMGAFLMAAGGAALALGAIGVLASPGGTTPYLVLVVTALGALYVPLGHAVRRWRSASALAVATGLVLLLLLAAAWEGRSTFDALDSVQAGVLTVAVLVAMWRGFTAIGDARELDREQPPTAPR